MKRSKIIIIGAGPAGLTAAYYLLKNSTNYEVIIIESEAEVGGISKTINYKGNRMDIGGHRFFTKNKQILAIWEELLPHQSFPSRDEIVLKINKDYQKNGVDPEKDDKVMLKRRRLSRIYYNKKFFDYPVSLSLATIKNMGLSNTTKCGFSYLKNTLLPKEETNLENFYINRFGKKLYSMFFEKYTEKVWGRHPSIISADWGAQRVKGLSIKEVLKNAFHKLFKIEEQTKETSLIEEFMYPKFGPGQLWEEMANKIIEMGGVIYKNSHVVALTKKKNKITSVTISHNEKKEIIKGDIFLSSMPLKDLVSSMNDVPTKINDIALNLPYRDFITVGLLINKLKLKNKSNINTINNIIPDCWLYIQDPDVLLGRIQVFNNWSPYMVCDENTVWLGLEYFCNEGDNLWNMSEIDFTNNAINELVKLNIIDKDDVLDSHYFRIKKAYPAYFDSYANIDTLKTYLNKIDNLYCIGRNGQHRYNNMDHSMLTSIMAIDTILNQDKDKEKIWNVNTEQEYHEEKSSSGTNEKPKN